MSILIEYEEVANPSEMSRAQDPRVDSLIPQLKAFERALDAVERDVGKLKGGAESPPPKDDSWLKRHAHLGTLFSALFGSGAALALAFYLASDYIDHQIEAKLTTRLASTSRALEDQGKTLRSLSESDIRIETKLDALTSLITPALLNQMKRVAAEPPTDPDNQRTAKQLVAAASKGAIPIPIETVKQAGERFIEASDQGAWDVGMDFLAYRSTLNTTPPQFETMKPPQENFWTLTYPYMRDPTGPGTFMAFVSAKRVRASEAAVSEKIGAAPTNVGKEFGPNFILFEAKFGTTEFKLDGFRLRGVVFRNCTIAHGGGPVDLSNVIFVNCTFRFVQSETTTRLAKTILESGPVSFTGLV